MSRFRTVNLSAVALSLGVALASGCVSTRLEVSEDHPARPSAAAGVAANPAVGLQTDAALYVASNASESATAQTPDGTRQNPYVGQGVIQDAGGGVLIIQHREIPGFMRAMTMMYPVAEDVDIESLASGNEILFRIETLESGGHQIFSVEDWTTSEGVQEVTHEHETAGRAETPDTPQR
jgi:Cu/Ag efflux protein CusF